MLEQVQVAGKVGIIVDSNGTRQDHGIEVNLSHLLSMWIASNPEHGERYTYRYAMYPPSGPCRACYYWDNINWSHLDTSNHMIASEVHGHTCTDTVSLYTLPIPPMQRQKSLSLSGQYGCHTELAADAASFFVLSKNILFLGILPYEQSSCSSASDMRDRLSTSPF